MLLSLALALHLLSAVVWVGGMFFAYMALRPAAAAVLEPPQRLALWVHTFGHFFPWVWVAIVLLPVTGYGLAFHFWHAMAHFPFYVNIMQGLGIVMILIYLHVFFAPYRRLKRAVAAQDWPTGARALSQIRLLVGINTLLGLLVIAIAGVGRLYIGG